jgi:hypothetical protein
LKDASQSDIFSLKKPQIFFTLNTKKHKGFLIFLCAFWMFFTALPSAAQEQDNNTIVSINAQRELGDQNSKHPTLSADGRFVAYQSLATNLVENDTNDTGDIFIFDRLTQKTAQISVSSAGELANAISDIPAISGNGRRVVFRSKASNLNAENHHNAFDLYVHDRLTGTTELVNQTEWGELANEWSDSPSISFDGRFIGFASLADNLIQSDSNENWDIFIHDQVTGHIRLASQTSSGDQANGGSAKPILADNGRDLIYETSASNILQDENSVSAIVLYQRVLGVTTVIPLPVNRVSYQVMGMDLSFNANTLAYAICETIGSEDHLQVYVHQPKSDAGEPWLVQSYPAEVCHEQKFDLALAGNGEVIAVSYPIESQQYQLMRIDLTTHTRTILDEGNLGEKIDISATGEVVTYSKEIDGTSQIFIWDATRPITASHNIIGRVTDETGHPLALVTIETDQEASTRTDGQGYFWISGVSPGTVTVTPSKEGFAFTPQTSAPEVPSDRYDIDFVYTHQESLIEAQKNIGMPYSFNRGTNGPFHGFQAGYCTDLILDAYSWGVDFNIQFALEQDFRSQPWHYYRWRDSRNAHDMWRYFSYSGQMQPHENPYQPGDIVFFDWSQDGEIDHVAVVSEVSNNNRPLKMYDATGVININPSGLAAELPWENFHEETERGFARWSGRYEPVIAQLPLTTNLQMVLGSPGADIRLIDTEGRVVDANHVEIPGGRFDDWVWEQTISVNQPQETNYLVVVSNISEQETAYQLGLQFLSEGVIANRREYKGIFTSSAVQSYAISLRNRDNSESNLSIRESRRVSDTLNRE